MTNAETILAARDLISDPEHWTKGVHARDAKGGALCSVTSPEAAALCADGALLAECEMERYVSYAAVATFLSRAAKKLGSFNDFVVFNDSHTHAEVMEMFDLAAKLAKEADDAGL